MNFNIHKVAVLGSGVMGAGIAAHIAGAGIPVILLDIIPKELSEAEKNAGLTLEHSSVRNRIAQAGKERVTNPKNGVIYDRAMSDMIQVGNFTDHMELLNECDWIIEVIVEDLKTKKAFMEQIRTCIKPGTIVSTNTSGVSINGIVEDLSLEFRQYFMGTHFFNPPRYMKLLELIPGDDTLTEVVDFMKEFATKRLGKGVVIAKDTPGFIANRIGAYGTATTVKLTEKYGYNFAKVDKLTGTIIRRPKSATFRTLDMVGLDIFSNVANNTKNAISSEEEKKSFDLPDFVQQLIENGQLGDKSKQGFYKATVSEKGKATLLWDYVKQEYVDMPQDTPEALRLAEKSPNPIAAIINGDSEENRFVWELVKRTLLYSASKIPEIAEDYKEIDNGMKWGYNWELGPFELWDEIGLEQSVKKMEEEGEKIPEWIKDRIAHGHKKFYKHSDIEMPFINITSPSYKIINENEGAAVIDIGDDVLCLTFRTKGNTITDDVIEMMSFAVEATEMNYKGLVIGNQTKNFSAGANLELIAKAALDKKFEYIDQTVAGLQNVNMAIKYCKKPVVAAPFGMTLGGGAEIVLHTCKVAAHAETYMGLVEAGVGLIPAGGGIKELLVRSMDGLDNAPAGEIITHLRSVWENISMAKVSTSAHDAIRKGYLRELDQVVMNKDYLIDEAKRTVLFLAEGEFRPLQKKLVRVLGTTGKAALQYNLDFMKRGGFISEHDALIATKVAHVLTGGDVVSGTLLQEEKILELEKEAFISLCKEEKTLQRIEHMLKTGKPLRN